MGSNVIWEKQLREVLFGNAGYLTSIQISENDPTVKKLIETNIGNNLEMTHITLAHRRSHGVTAVANYGRFVNQKVPFDVTALILSDKLAAFEAQPRSIDGQKIMPKNEWPRLTLWTAQGIHPKEANTLPQLVLLGRLLTSSFCSSVEPVCTTSNIMDCSRLTP